MSTTPPLTAREFRTVVAGIIVGGVIGLLCAIAIVATIAGTTPLVAAGLGAMLTAAGTYTGGEVGLALVARRRR